MRGQFSLEMVVGLIILLVVAGVVIGLVLFYISPQKMPKPGEEIGIRTFLSKCENYCLDQNSLDYCRYYYEGNDWNRNGVKYEVIGVGKHGWLTCEDRVFCFLVVPCEDRFGSGLEALKKCKNILCQTYIEKYGNVEKATEALLRDISFSTKCNLNNVPDEENWFVQVFKKGCG